MKILGLINARGGSKGIPRKNLQLLCGKPLISYAIKSGKESEFVDRVVVSTEDNEIGQVAKKYGAEVPFKRPKELSRDNVTQYPPTRHAILELKKQGWTPDIVVLLMANGPIKTGEDVDKSIEALINSDADSVRSVCEVLTPPFWMYKINENDLITPFIKRRKIEDPAFSIRQNHPKIYQTTGVIDVLWTKNLFKTRSLFGKKIKAYIFNQIKSVDIDNQFDMMIAETIMKNYKNLI